MKLGLKNGEKDIAYTTSYTYLSLYFNCFVVQVREGVNRKKVVRPRGNFVKFQCIDVFSVPISSKHSFLTFDFYTENKMAANLNLNTKFTMGSKSETKYV